MVIRRKFKIRNFHRTNVLFVLFQSFYSFNWKVVFEMNSHRTEEKTVNIGITMSLQKKKTLSLLEDKPFYKNHL